MPAAYSGALHYMIPLSKRLLSLACTSAFVLSATLFASGQNAALGNVSGDVRDPQGALVPDVTVVVTNTGTGASRTLTTDSHGHYAASFLQPGQYEIVIGGGSFGKIDQKNVAVTVGSTATVDANLRTADVTTSVVVTTEAPLLDTDKVDFSQSVSQVLVSNLPVNGRRWDNFVLLTPNVAPDGNTGLIAFRGVSGLYNTNLVDGANNQQAFFSEARGRSIGAPYVYPLDAIQEFESSVTGYSAEFGQAAGGIVNAITKSGGNKFHGDIFEYYRTPGFNALDALNKYNGRITNNPYLLVQPVKVQNQFGASVGGPIIKDKLFFHATYDGYRKVNPITYLSTYNNGSSSIAGLTGLCDQHTGTPYSPDGGVTRYPSTITNVSPAQCSAAVSFIQNKLLGAYARNATQDIYFPRLDYQLNSKTHLSASYLFENFKQPNGYNTSTTVSNGSVTQNGTQNFHQRYLVANAETALSSRSANVVHFQFARDLEVANTNTGGPANSVSNLFAYGETSALPRGAFPDEHRIQITDIYSTTRGKHSLKAGVDVNLIHEQIANLFGGDGSFSYSSGSAELNFANWIQDAYSVNGGRHYTSFSQTVDPITGIGADDFWNKNLDVFLEDSWRLTPKFLLSLGARYDVQLVPQPDKPNTNGAPAIAATSTINTNYHMVQPRVGFSWNPQEGTVVRGGYGIFYGLTSNSTFYTVRRENGVYQQQFGFTAATTPTNTYVAAGAACVPTNGANRCFQQSGAYQTYAPVGGVPIATPPGPAPVNLLTGAGITPVNTNIPASQLALRGISPDFTNPYTHSMDLSVEQQLPLRSTFTISYVGTRGMRLPVFVDSNVDPTSAVTSKPYIFIPGNGAPVQSISEPIYTKRLSPLTSSVLTGYSDVNSWYHSMAVSVHKPMSHGVELLANYTWAKNMDGGQSSGTNGTFNGTDAPLIPFALGHRQGRGAEYARSDLDQRGRFVGSIVTKSSLPIANRYLAYGVNGWQLSGTLTAQTGFPVTAFFQNTIPSAINGDGGITGAIVTSGTGTRVPSQIAGRNAFNGPGVHNTDARISRDFPFLREGMSLQISAEAFNVLNHRNILSVNNSAYTFVAAGGTGCAVTTPASAGCIVPYTATPFGSPLSTSNILYGPRQIQLVGKLFF
jgi:hypothetical protein